MKALPTLGAMAIAGAMAVATTAPASATRLVFLPGPSQALVNQDYGDNVTSEIDGVFMYGAEGGFTPNVTTEYAPLGVRTFINGYGDLINVIWNGSTTDADWVITLTAEKGFEVALEKFDLAAFGGDLTLDSLTVDWGDGNQTFSDQLISSSGHNEFLFNPAIVRGPSISITILEGDSRGFFGLDNLVFSQVPAPGMGVAGMLGALFVMRRRRRS